MCFPCKVICLSSEDQRNRIKKVPSQAASYNKGHRLETAVLRWASLHLVIKCHMKKKKNTARSRNPSCGGNHTTCEIRYNSGYKREIVSDNCTEADKAHKDGCRSRA